MCTVRPAVILGAGADSEWGKSGKIEWKGVKLGISKKLSCHHVWLSHLTPAMVGGALSQPVLHWASPEAPYVALKTGSVFRHHCNELPMISAVKLAWPTKIEESKFGIYHMSLPALHAITHHYHHMHHRSLRTESIPCNYRSMPCYYMPWRMSCNCL
jgi:hypothetical protein